MTESPFKALVRDRECAHMARELFPLRDALFGADATIRQIDGADGPVGLYGEPGMDDPQAGEKGFVKLFGEVSRYVQETAWGEAALQIKGHLPKSKPFKGPITAPLRATKQDFKKLHLHVGTDLSSPDMARGHEDEAALRVRLQEHVDSGRDVMQSGLDATSEEFANLADEMFKDMSLIESETFPDNDVLRLNIPQKTIEEALTDVKPLSEKFKKEALNTSSPPSLELLEEYRSRGEAIRNKLANDARAAGNEFFAKAASLKGADKAFAYERAEALWSSATITTQTAEAAYCNLAALLLLKKEYAQAYHMAKAALEAQKHRLYDPPTYKKKRGAALVKFQLGELPKALLHRRTEAQIKADNVLAWKAHVRVGRALGGLALKRLEPGLVKSAANRNAALCYRDDAVKAFDAARALDPSDQTPTREEEELRRQMMKSISTNLTSQELYAAVQALDM